MTTESGNQGLRRLVDQPLRLPEHMEPVVAALQNVTDPLCEVVTEFIRKPVEAEKPTAARILSEAPDPENGVCFECHPVNGVPTLRFMLPQEDIATLSELLFGRPMDEPNLRASIAQGFANRLAMTLIMESGAAYQPPEMVQSRQKPLSNAPVLAVSYTFTVADGVSLSVSMEFARPFTDTINQPATTIPDATLADTPFPVIAVLADEKMTLSVLDALTPGQVVPLKEASLEKIDLRAVAPKRSTSLARGVLGTDKGIRSIQLGEAAKVDASPMSSAAGDEEEAFDPMADLGIEMNFAQQA